MLENFLNEFEILLNKKQSISYNRKPCYYISSKRLFYLFEQYYIKIDINSDFSFVVIEFDKNDILFLLRVHFKLYVELNENVIKIFKCFPTKFQIIKDVTPHNHWFAPKSFLKGKILYYKKDLYKTANLMNGIPLSEELSTFDSDVFVPTTQINYEYFKVF